MAELSHPYRPARQLTLLRDERMSSKQNPPTATDYIDAEENNLRIQLAELGFKILFRFFGAVVTVLGALSFGRDRP